MKDNGTVPYFHEIRDVALICNSYNVSIETIASIGKKWVESGNMMKNTPSNMKEADEVGRMVVSEDLPLEQHDNANDVWQHLRNPG